MANLFPRGTAAIAGLNAPGSCPCNDGICEAPFSALGDSPTVLGGFLKHLTTVVARTVDGADPFSYVPRKSRVGQRCVRKEIEELIIHCFSCAQRALQFFPGMRRSRATPSREPTRRERQGTPRGELGSPRPGGERGSRGHSLLPPGYAEAAH